MRFRLQHRARVCGPEMIFEELEQRIVLDASIDAAPSDADLTGFDLMSGPGHIGPTDSHAPHGAGHVTAGLNTADREHGDWDLEYSSDPKSSIAQFLDTHDLMATGAELGVPAPSITIGIIPPVTGYQTNVDLSGAVRVNGDPTMSLDVVVTYNPRPLTSNGIASMSFTQTEVLDVSIDEPGLGVEATTWHISGPFDAVNAILATMQATVNTNFNGFAEIDVSVTDPDHTTNVNDAPLVIRTLYIPVDKPPYMATPTVPAGPVAVASGAPIALPVSVADKDSAEVAVTLKVDHGTLYVPTAPCMSALAVPTVMYFGTEGPDGRPLESGMLVGVRGHVEDLQCVLSHVEYRSFPGYHGQDTLTVFATDQNYTERLPCSIAPATAITPIIVV